MGRTNRKRKRKRDKFLIKCLDNTSSIIELKRWMKRNDWQNNCNLKLSHFNETDRGLTSKKYIKKHDVLIEIPYELMITYTTINQSYLSYLILKDAWCKLEMQDLLTIYLVFEKHKAKSSKWKFYIDTLPEKPPLLPWLSTRDEIQLFPEPLQTDVLKRRNIFEASWTRSVESINSRWKCECCKIPGHRVLTLNSFTWAYVMVNTRAVYVDPDIVCGLSKNSENNPINMLSDAPSMALCPYLDMFNHSNYASTQAELVRVNKKWQFRLTTLTPFKKYNEIFISYGSYNNAKLLCEYGFFIEDDDMDVIEFNMQEVFSGVQVTKRQYQFIVENNFNKGLYVSINGVSFNLKANLFTVLNPQHLNWQDYVFNERYSNENLALIYKHMVKPLQNVFVHLRSEICKMKERNGSDNFKNVYNYLKYKLNFIKSIEKCVKANFNEL